LSNPSFPLIIPYRHAGLDLTQSPIYATTLLLDNNVPPAELQQPTTDTVSLPNDPPFLLVHLLQFQQQREQMKQFDDLSASRKASLGICAAAWFQIHCFTHSPLNTIAHYDEIRLDYMPSLTTWSDLLATEPETWSKQHEMALNTSISISSITTMTPTPFLTEFPHLYNN